MSRLFFALIVSTGLVLALAYPYPEDAEDSGSPTEAAVTEATGSGGSESTTQGNGGVFTQEQCKQYQEQCSSKGKNIWDKPESVLMIVHLGIFVKFCRQSKQFERSTTTGQLNY